MYIMFMNTKTQTDVFLDWVTKVIADLTFWVAWAPYYTSELHDLLAHPSHNAINSLDTSDDEWSEVERAIHKLVW